MNMTAFSRKTNRSFRDTNHFSRITNHFSRITNHFPRNTNRFSRITNHFSRITNHFSRITNHFSRNTNQNLFTPRINPLLHKKTTELFRSVVTFLANDDLFFWIVIGFFDDFPSNDEQERQDADTSYEHQENDEHFSRCTQHWGQSH